MSEIVKLNIKSRNFRAVVSDSVSASEKFIEFPEIIEREKQEQAHKNELENEYEKGYAKGKEDIKNELEKAHVEELLIQSKNFYSILSTFELKIKDFEKDFHQLVISVSKSISEKIIGLEIENNSKIEELLKENLRKIIGANDIVVKLNPQDFDLIQKSSQKYLGTSGLTKINFEPNENIQLGGCVIESEIGNLDARVGSRISEIIKTLENKFTKLKTE